MMRELRGYLMIMGAALLWGMSATAAKYLLNLQIDTLLIVQSRVTFSFLLLLLYYLLFQPRVLRVQRRDLWRFALLGVVGIAGSNFTYYFTIKETTVATAILVQYTAPLLVAAYAALTHEEKITPVKLVAALISLAGCFLAVGGYDVRVLKITTVGAITGVASIFCFSFLTVFARHLYTRYGSRPVMFYGVAFASLFWLVVSPPWRAVTAGLPAAVWVQLFGLAVVSILIPFSLYLAGLRHVVATRAIITSTLEPVVAIVSAAALLGEFLEAPQVAGAFLVITAIVLLQVRREPESVSIPVDRSREAPHAP